MHGSTSVMLLHTEHRPRLALTSRTAAASASASSSLERRMWNARRWALLVPTPGSFLSSSIRRDMGSANLDMRIEELSNYADSILVRRTPPALVSGESVPYGS